jgi:Flp pilus assembly protein TadD
MPDLHPATAAYADEETVDTDFLHYLVRGADLLQSGSADQARSMLEHALKLSPKSQRGQNLLALSYFKLGLFDRAEDIYRGLVEDHPDDAALRVNLGLVYLKKSKSDEAVSAFTSVVTQVPTHTKATNYLGLAYMQKHDFANAKEWFEKAGNTAMVDKMIAQAAKAAAPVVSVPPGPRSIAPRPAGFNSAPRFNSIPAGNSAGEPTMPPFEPTAPDLAAFSAAHKLDSIVGAPFAIAPSMISIEVQSELFVRLEGLVAVFGSLDLKPAFKRFRGRVTEKPFGDPGHRMMHASGKGRLFIAPGDRRFHAVEIGDEPSYFREDVLFAFEESLIFENGRVPSKFSGDLQLVHLRNRGRAMLISKNQPRSIEIKKDEPCRVLMDVLLGWHGNITPRVVAIAEEAAEDGSALAGIELTGEGSALLDAAL